MPSVSGIYVILHKKSGKIYLGQAQDIVERFGEHRSALNHNRHHNRHLQFAWNQDGAKAFQFKILERCNPEQLNEREGHFLKLYMGKRLCYNFAEDPTAPFRGRKHTEESKRRISESGKGHIPHNKGQRHSAETRAKMSAAQQNRLPPTEETRRKIGAKHKGKTISDEHRRAVSEAAKNRPPRKNSDEVKKKMSEAAKRRWQRQREAENESNE
jgi:group I intron endonuclease